MKFCQPHWNKLKDAIKAKGLWHLCSQSSEEANKRMKLLTNAEKPLEDSELIKNYDPLLVSHFMIMDNALEMGGPYLMIPKSDGSQYCPLCELEAHKESMGEDSDQWIESAASGSLEFCKKHGLI